VAVGGVGQGDGARRRHGPGHTALLVPVVEGDAGKGGSIKWPCEYHAAQSIRLKVAASGRAGAGGTGFDTGTGPAKKKLVAVASFEPAEIQELGDVVPKLLELKAKSKVPIQFQVRIELGDGSDFPPPSLAEQLNKILATVKDGFRVQ
jgi:hypothetical protein